MYPIIYSITHPKQAAGFTLIELSIVLVIIGLIVGGVLVGQDLIKAAEVRSQIGQIESIKTAAMTFKLKYNCVAGDCKNASTFGFTPSATSYDNGNGDRVLSNAWNWWYNPEQYNFWYQLSNAGLIAGKYAGWTNAINAADQTSLTYPPDAYVPKAKISGGYVHVAGSTGPYGNAITLYKPNVQFGTVYYGRLLSVPQAFAIDTKIDDGQPSSGKVMKAYPEYYLRIPASQAAAAADVDWGCTNPNAYDHAGNWQPGYIAETTPNPERSEECMLIFTNAF